MAMLLYAQPDIERIYGYVWARYSIRWNIVKCSSFAMRWWQLYLQTHIYGAGDRLRLMVESTAGPQYADFAKMDCVFAWSIQICINHKYCAKKTGYPESTERMKTGVRNGRDGGRGQSFAANVRMYSICVSAVWVMWSDRRATFNAFNLGFRSPVASV